MWRPYGDGILDAELDEIYLNDIRNGSSRNRYSSLLNAPYLDGPSLDLSASLPPLRSPLNKEAILGKIRRLKDALGSLEEEVRGHSCLGEQPQPLPPYTAAATAKLQKAKATSEKAINTDAWFAPIPLGYESLSKPKATNPKGPILVPNPAPAPAAAATTSSQSTSAGNPLINSADILADVSKTLCSMSKTLLSSISLPKLGGASSGAQASTTSATLSDTAAYAADLSLQREPVNLKTNGQEAKEVGPKPAGLKPSGTKAAGPKAAGPEIPKLPLSGSSKPSGLAPFRFCPTKQHYHSSVGASSGIPFSTKPGTGHLFASPLAPVGKSSSAYKPGGLYSSSKKRPTPPAAGPAAAAYSRKWHYSYPSGSSWSLPPPFYSSSANVHSSSSLYPWKSFAQKAKAKHASQAAQNAAKYDPYGYNPSGTSQYSANFPSSSYSPNVPIGLLSSLYGQSTSYTTGTHYTPGSDSRAKETTASKAQKRPQPPPKEPEIVNESEFESDSIEAIDLDLEDYLADDYDDDEPIEEPAAKRSRTPETAEPQCTPESGEPSTAELFEQVKVLSAKLNESRDAITKLMEQLH